MMNTRIFRSAVYSCCVIAIMLLVGSCEPASGTGKSPVYLTVEGDDAWGLYIDVWDSSISGGVSDDLFDIIITSHYKNEDVTSQYADVILQEYRVYYYRVDGEEPVPDPFTVQFTGTVPADGTYDMELLIMRATAKLESPLAELALGGGEGYLDLNAIIYFYGEDLMGNEVETSYTLFIRAADI